ncbi:MAG: hypothetical protein J0I11_00780 [Actinobacteria bacterium]|nr:hypothetical protein [Actinomycetota bacterium]
MTTDLTARLLAEIERREAANQTDTGTGDIVRASAIVAYLAALRGVVGLHRNAGGGCHECEYDWPCDTVRAVATALDVTP